ncbi:MAG: UDP-N-acetylmuramoyl-tripeptide--D-alanyl-D-alanine ligase [Gammaproteobacteria bacterium]|nr:MAG: UDP-N-acetylmuramoyl-tripeptide--D-alanyl-D-alanine ligase [Gammaproteobacteria bacterium]
MIDLSLIEIAGALDAKILTNNSYSGVKNNVNELVVSFVCTDTRTIASKSKDDNYGTLFIAIKGPHFDAHKFLLEAQELGVSALIVEDLIDKAISIPQIQVKNTRVALAKISQVARNKSAAKFIGVTGSSGKTTVKEMIASILKQKGNTFATVGNFNNSIGVPLSLLQIENTTEYAVLELGASQIGEITFTADLVNPQVALVNNVSAAHLEGFGDLQGVAEAKSEIYASLSDKGTAVINLDDNFAKYFLQKCQSKVMTFSVNNLSTRNKENSELKADVYAQNINLDCHHKASFDLVFKSEKVEISLPLVGKHNINNALAAASCCLAIGCSLATIAKGLSKVTSVDGRLNIAYHSSGCRIIDDTYNANLDSIKVAIDLLSEYQSPKILVLGDMAELGDQARQAHEEVGHYALTKNIDRLYTYGEFTKLSHNAFNPEISLTGRHFNNHSDLTCALLDELKTTTTILVKGSRSSHMEKIVQSLLQAEVVGTNNKNKKQANAKLQSEMAEGEI